MRLGDLHAAGARDAADVVAPEVDQHHVLGALLRVGEQLALDRESSSGVAPRGRVPAIGRSVTLVAVEPHQDLGRGADHVVVAEVEVVHVGRRIDRRAARGTSASGEASNGA